MTAGFEPATIGAQFPVMLVAVVADTHIPRRAKALPPGLLPHLRQAGCILHAGDLMQTTLLDELAGYAPVLAVRGNLDPPQADPRLPESREFELEGVQLAMVHDSGPARGRRNRSRRRFPGARVVIFGHSHIPVLEDDGELMLLNPGSPTDKRRQPEHTCALLEVSGGEAQAEIFPV